MIAFFYDMLYILPVALTAIYYYCGVFDAPYRTPVMYVLEILFLSVLALFPQLKARGRLLLTGVSLIAAGGIVFAYSRKDEASEAAGAVLGPLFLILLLAFLAGMLMSRIWQVRWALTGVIAILVALSLEFLRLPESAGKGIFASFFLAIVTVADGIHMNWKRSGDTDVRKHMVYTAPFILGVVLLASLFKYPDHPYGWDGFVNIWNRITIAFEEVRFNMEGGGDTVLGFSEDGEVRPSFGRGSETVLLEVEAPTEIYAPVYLAGTYYGDFDGHRWTGGQAEIKNGRRLDVLESLASAKAGTEDYRDVIRDASLYVQYVNAKSRYFFAPSKLYSFSVLSKSGEINDDALELTFKTHNPFRFRAGTSFYRFNTDHPVFYEYMAGEPALTQEVWEKEAGNAGSKETYEEYLEYRETLRKAYGGEVSVSPELREKLDLIYSGAESDYDKMKRLERALGAMSYSDNTSPIPESVVTPGDFLDFFLIDSREGFCTHFATAFVLLARAEGLPTRYVQGYRVELDGAGVYSVTDDAAHAWPEVYFEGKGWVTFEPTPGFNREVSWMTVSAKRDMYSAKPYVPEVFDKAEESKPTEKEAVKIDPLVILLPVSAIILFLTLFTLVARALSKRRFARLTEEGKLRWLLKDILACLSIIGFERRDSETLSEFAKRVAEGWNEKKREETDGQEETIEQEETGRLVEEPGNEDESEVLIKTFTDVAERLLYSEFKINPGDLPVLSEYHREVLKKLKETNRLRYILRSLFSGSP